ncbi:hypothetical protein E2C01_009533 [Portunus trituberculatus]|uniref:Uncharacterized protein n=1 Tax=Portunus trituberculatus TaxID=210409 RepID=A0A5B7D620_PORTR|nr:hypothetical protein [Portunus trituberculatus]
MICRARRAQRGMYVYGTVYWGMVWVWCPLGSDGFSIQPCCLIIYIFGLGRLRFWFNESVRDAGQQTEVECIINKQMTECDITQMKATVMGITSSLQ